MFCSSSTHSLSLKCLTALLMAGVLSVAAADSSTGIRLGNTDFGGKHTNRLGTTDRHTTDRSWSRTAPDQRSWSRQQYHQNSQTQQNDWHDSQHKSDRHTKHHRQQRNLGGIQGHPSFGLSTTPKHPQHHYQGYYRPPALYYHSPRVGVQVYTVPQVYSSGYDRYTPSGGTISRDYADRNQEHPPAETSINPWTALGEYQFHTARYAFEAQIQQQPYAALPRVGLALSTALAGQLDAAAFAMQDALLSDTQDLRFFNAEPSIQLILEELLLSYEGDPLMTASLHYLNQDFVAAERAVEVAANYCQPCTAVDNLDALISAQL